MPFLHSDTVPVVANSDADLTSNSKVVARSEYAKKSAADTVLLLSCENGSRVETKS
jgi:hypothetical protein